MKLCSRKTILRKNYVWIKYVATRHGFNKIKINKILFKIAINCGQNEKLNYIYAKI